MVTVFSQKVVEFIIEKLGAFQWNTLPSNNVQTQLQEIPAEGVLICFYDFFLRFWRLEKQIERCNTFLLRIVAVIIGSPNYMRLLWSYYWKTRRHEGCLVFVDLDHRNRTLGGRLYCLARGLRFIVRSGLCDSYYNELFADGALSTCQGVRNLPILFSIALRDIQVTEANKGERENLDWCLSILEALFCKAGLLFAAESPQCRIEHVPDMDVDDETGEVSDAQTKIVMHGRWDIKVASLVILYNLLVTKPDVKLNATSLREQVLARYRIGWDVNRPFSVDKKELNELLRSIGWRISDYKYQLEPLSGSGRIEDLEAFIADLTLAHPLQLKATPAMSMV